MIMMILLPQLVVLVVVVVEGKFCRRMGMWVMGCCYHMVEIECRTFNKHFMSVTIRC